MNVAVLLLLVLAAPEAEPAVVGEGYLDSPREAFRVFLEAMVDVKEGREDRLDDAVATLDLSGVPPLIREEAGPKLARNLKTYLDKVEIIDVDRIPADYGGDRWVYLRDPNGEVAVERGEDGQWRFSPATLESLPDLLASVRDESFVEGIEGGGGAPEGLAGWVRARLPAPLRERLFLLENWQWLAILLLAFLGAVIDRVFRFLFGIWLRRLLARSAELRERKVDTDFETPLGILVMAIFWWMTVPTLDLPLTALLALKFATQLLMAGSGVWAAYRFVDVGAAHFAAIAAQTDTRVDDILIPLIRRALKITVVAFGVLFVAQNLDIDVTSLLAGLGIGGLAFALAARDTIENLFGSVTVLIDRPFHIGDWVIIGDVDGTVIEIGFRSTRIRTFYNSVITVPNSTLVKASVDNLGARRYRRVKAMLSIQYDTPPDKIEAFCEGIREIIRRHPYTRKDYYMVYFNEFSDSSFDILLYAFHETPDWPTELRERHRLFVDVVRLAHRLGVSFAFPTRTLHIASGGTVEAAPTERSVEGDPLRIGRREAESIVSGRFEAIQPPVDFVDPETM